MNFELKIDMGKPDWDKPNVIYTHNITADSWEDAEEQAKSVLAYDTETFLSALRGKLDYNHSINSDYVTMTEVVYELNEAAYHRKAPVKLKGELSLIGGCKMIDVAKRYNEQSEMLATEKSRAIALAKIELERAQARLKELEDE